MGLREVESTLPPGFRFYPSDEELVCHYLYNKVANERSSQGTMVEVDLHTREPWELPDVAKLTAKEWYFFSFRDRKYATGWRTNRATRSGYWKATGRDRTIHDRRTGAVVGMRKTLVFYSGRAPNGQKTDWVMHEFRLETPHSLPKEDWVLCRVFHKRKVEENSAKSPWDNYDEEKNGCLPYREDVNDGDSVQNLMQSSLAMETVEEQHGFCWDVGLHHANDDLSFEELEFPAGEKDDLFFF
ncbi:hypothetical protein HPP92_004779 [Vanilla planifolia]|uniref:NAC domain-containing protein n=1 Tax=Vanilla planifolia TaxID=51239 RepID=A0A835RSU4_VANPL|nr:hypothetical protein HPP92_004779 [Vanilla planifolia]